MKTKSSFGEDGSSEPETIISSSGNCIKENLSSGMPEYNLDIQKQLKTIQRNFEIFVSEKYIKNNKSNIKMNSNRNVNTFCQNCSDSYSKRDNDFLLINSPNNNEKICEFGENNYRNFFTSKKFLAEVMNLNPVSKNLSDKILSEMENNYSELYSRFYEVIDQLNVAEIYQESNIFNFYRIHELSF